MRSVPAESLGARARHLSARALPALVAGVLAATLVWVAVDRPPAGTAEGVLPSTADAAAPPAGLAASATVALGEAIAAIDQRAARALAPGEDAGAGDLLAALATNADRLRIVDLSIEYVGEAAKQPAGRHSTADAWTGEVAVGWRLDGSAPPQSSRVRVRMGFEVVGERVAITGVQPGPDPLPLWLSGPVQVRRQADRGAGTLVLAAAPPQSGSEPGTHGVELGSYSRAASQAVRVVRRVLPAWRDQLVVEVPSSAADLDELLDRPPGSSAGIAAVTAPADGADGPAHVFVNPEQWDRLDRLGRQVVASHEATHAATDAQRSAAPLWLVEGFADYVALRDIDLPDRQLSRALLDQVGRDGVPDRLPDASDFDAGQGDAEAAYQGAWLAAELLAEAGGEQELVTFYRSVDTGDSVEAALRTSFGLSRAELVRRWRQRVSDLAS